MSFTKRTLTYFSALCIGTICMLGIFPASTKAVCIVNENGTYIEAEHFTGSQQLRSSPTVNNEFSLIDDSKYSNGKALIAGSGGSGTTTPQNEIKEYELSFPVAGIYKVWIRGHSVGNDNTNSMFFTLDSQTWKAWRLSATSSNLEWVSNMQVGSGNSVSVSVVAPGTHTFKIAMREDDSVIDGFYITMGNEVPTNAVLNPTATASTSVINPQTGCAGAYWSSEPNLVGVTNFLGYNAPPTAITLSNIGQDDTQSANISVNQTWVQLDNTTIAPMLAGGTHTINLNFTTASLAAGTYNAEITVTGAAYNSGMTIPITLLVKDAPATASCGEVPLYAQNLVNPAIMVQLDTSGSMSTTMSLATTVDQNTPSLSGIVQSIVNRTGWSANNAMGFVISRGNQTGTRRAWSYDGQQDDAPTLTIKYTAGGAPEETFTRTIFGSQNDVQATSTAVNTTATYLELGRANEPVGLRFTDVSVPQGATINDAYITFSAYQGDTATTNVVISGVAQDNVGLITSTPTALTTLSTSWSPTSWRQTMQRINIAEDVLQEVFQDRSIAWGFANWAGGSCSSNDSDQAPTYYTRYLVGAHEHDQTHYDALQDHVDDGSPNGCTPLVPTMRAGLEYFKGNRTDNYYTANYTKLSCQPRIMVIVTDGYGNTATTNTGIDTVVDDLIREGVSVVTVGFGLDNATQLNRIVQRMQTAGEADPDDDLYHLHNEDANGVAIPFMAQNRQEFIEAMNSIVSNVKAQIFYGASPAATTSVSDESIGVLVNASFDASNWSGTITAKSFNSYTGELSSTDLWSTDTTITSGSINGFIASSSGAVTQYTEASCTGDNYLCKPLGDIINSVPQLIGVPPYFYSFDKYYQFKYNSLVRQRSPLAYVAANDGALHAINISDGTEAWRFYPSSVTNNLILAQSSAKDDMCSSAYCHKFLLDGSPQAADIAVDYDNDTTTADTWRTILTTGLGKGGKAFFGLDVTYGNDFDAATNPSTLLWEFTHADLGLATSVPDTRRVAVFSESANPSTTATTDDAWVTIFGSGTAETSLLQAQKEAYIYAINSWDASEVWEDNTSANVFRIKLSATELKNDAPSPPIVVDLIADDYLSDAIYVGNLYGNMYRITNIGQNQTPVVSQILNSGLTDHARSISAKAEIAYAGYNDFWVYFGTGRYIEQVDKFTADQQYFFALQDNFDTLDSTDSTKNELHEVAEKNSAYTMSDLSLLQTGIITGYVTDSNGDPIDSNGNGTIDINDMQEFRTISCTTPNAEGKCNADGDSWALQLARPNNRGSERVISQPLIVAGIAFFATFIPDDDTCAGDGDTWLFAIDSESGEIVTDAVFDLNGDNIFDSSDRQVKTSLTGTNVQTIGGIYIGKGKPTSELVLHNDVLFVGTSAEPPIPLKVNLPAQRVQLKAWRQKFN